MRCKIFMLIALSILAYHKATGQNNTYQFSHLDISNGLSINQVSSIFKDSKGFMWFGTVSGLNRYDGYKFRVFKHEKNNAESLRDNSVATIFEGPGDKMWVNTHSGFSIYCPVTEKFSNNIATELSKYSVHTGQLTVIRKDQRGNFWFLTNKNGLYCYHPKDKYTSYFSTGKGSKPVLHANTIADVISGSNGVVWFVYDDGVVEQFDGDKKAIISRSNDFAKANTSSHRYSGVLGSDGDLWLYAEGSQTGVYRYHTKTNVVDHYTTETGDIRLNSNVINNVIVGDDKKIWIGTDHGGINLIDPSENTIRYLVNREDDIKSLRGDCVVLYKDNIGIIWAGTFKQGICYYHESISQFPLVRHYMLDSKSLPYEDVDCFADDSKGDLWIGTNGGGLLYYNATTKKYSQYKHRSNDPNSLANDVVVSLCVDHEHKLWIGTYYGGLDCFDGRKFTHYRHHDNIPSSISDDRVYTIMEDSSQKLWVGTFAGSNNVFERATNSFLHPKYHMISNYTSVIYEDNQKNIWIGHDKGVDFIKNGSNAVTHYVNIPGNPNSLIANDVNSIVQDKNGMIWIGTKEGLSVLDAKTNKFYNIDHTNGLPSDRVLNVLEENSGTIWISTANGLASIKPRKSDGHYDFQIDKFDESDGLQGREFNQNAAYKTKDGELIFGGAHGYNIFNPKNINTTKSKLRLVFTDFQLFHKSVSAGDTVNNNVILKKSISYTKNLTLSHNQNDFNIEFSACEYFNPDKIVYQYRLEGFDNQWLSASNNTRIATYTNLDAGTYTFKLKAARTNDPKNISTSSLVIEVLPPIWKTLFAYILYLVAAIGLLFYIRHREIRKLSHEFQLEQDKLESDRKIEQEREKARRMHEVDLMKIKFFTNISHELRTPLSLIISPIENLIRNNKSPEQHLHLVIMKRNGERLLNLVNHLLDFRKMEFNELKLNLKKGDIIEFIKDVSSSFENIAEQNHITYFIESEIKSLIVKFDHEKIERVMFNLLSNAFKFTGSGGSVSVFTSLQIQDAETADKQLVEIKVIDTGIGIPKEIHEKVFERFFQDALPENLLNQGSGIGLSIAREFVKMHGGDISIENNPGKGSCFSIKLPLALDYDTELSGLEQQQIAIPEESCLSSFKKPVILIVEDNDEFRFYLRENLKHSFTIIEALNGKDGWQRALGLHPDVIVSDISMPEMNGIDLCKKLKNDSRTAHLPVILLSASAEEEQQLTGLANGAYDYLTKPLNFQILLSKINSVLLMQKILKKTYTAQVEMNAEEIIIESKDKKFLMNAISCIEKNITNINFSVEELSRQLSLSRVSLYKRLLTLTGKTPVDCIRTIRLKRAAQLLERSNMNIASIAYEVGFNNPNYFSRVFKTEYGMLPSEYISEMRKKELLEVAN